MPESMSTYKGFRIDDTAEWKMIIYISSTGLSAHLKHRENPLEPILCLADETWAEDEFTLLDNIENAVYKHPQLFDDFATEIIISSNKLLWVPTKIAQKAEENGEILDLFNEIYSAEESDIFIDTIGDLTAVYTLIPRLGSFLRRTLSGANINSELSILTSRFRKRLAEDGTIYINLRDTFVDIIAFDSKGLLVAMSHEWREISDVCYYVMNLIDVWNYDKNAVQVSVSGLRDARINLLKDLRNHVQFVMQTMLPSAVTKDGMPLAVSLKCSLS